MGIRVPPIDRTPAMDPYQQSDYSPKESYMSTRKFIHCLVQCGVISNTTNHWDLPANKRQLYTTIHHLVQNRGVININTDLSHLHGLVDYGGHPIDYRQLHADILRLVQHGVINYDFDLVYADRRLWNEGELVNHPQPDSIIQRRRTWMPWHADPDLGKRFDAWRSKCWEEFNAKVRAIRHKRSNLKRILAHAAADLLQKLDNQRTRRREEREAMRRAIIQDKIRRNRHWSLCYREMNGEELCEDFEWAVSVSRG